MLLKPVSILSALAVLAPLVSAGMEPFLGEIMLFAGNFAPQGYMRCDGQLLSIQQNSALFSILGTTYGGNGVQTFALPDLRGRSPVHYGSANGQQQVELGEFGGDFPQQKPVLGTARGQIALTTGQLPPHTHTATFSGGDTTNTITNQIPVVPAAGQVSPQANGFLAQGSATGSGAASIFAPPNAAGQKVNLNGGTSTVTSSTSGTVNVESTGGGENIPITLGLNANIAINRSPYLGLGYYIAVQGIFPSRN